MPALREYDDMKYFPVVEELADILCKKTQSSDPLFFRILVSYYLTKVASMMRCNIRTKDRGDIPVSMYGINLALSGHGKGHSTNIVEEQVINEFRERFLQETFPVISERNLDLLADAESIKNGSEKEDERIKINKVFKELGTLAFSFDSGTPAAVKQMRHKLLMSSSGSMNMEIDEIGSNLLGQQEALTTFLELYDVGKIKQKLIKNTKENERYEEIDGRTPTNMMLFGTPNKLLDGGKVEDEFTSMLDTGYARRCIFGYSPESFRNLDITAIEVYNNFTDTADKAYLQKLSHKLGNLADIINFESTLTVSKDVSLIIIEYMLACTKQADTYKRSEDTLAAEMTHRYFKALKLSGTYAFIDGSPEVTEEHFYNAVKLVEDSGKAFGLIIKRDPEWVRLAKYIAEANTNITHAEISADLPYFKGAKQHRDDLISLASSWGYNNNVVIKTKHADGIEFLHGESLQPTNLDEIIVSYSTDVAVGYKSELVPWKALHKLTSAPGYHFINHHLKETT